MGEKASVLAHPNACLGRAITAHPVDRLSDLTVNRWRCSYVYCKVDVRIPEAAADLHTLICIAVHLNTVQIEIELVRRGRCAKSAELF